MVEGLYCIKSIITYGYKTSADYLIQNIKIINNFSSKIKIKTPFREIQLKLATSFRHQIINMLVPLIIYEHNHIGIDSLLNKKINIPSLEGRGLFNKININNKYVTLIDESYNASPVSMKNCMHYFEKLKITNNQRKIIIIGEMLELGETEITLKSLKLSVNKIIFVVICIKKY